MDYRKIISNAVPEFIFDSRKINSKSETYKGFCSIFNPDLNDLMPEKLILKFNPACGNNTINSHGEKELDETVKKIQNLIFKASDIKLYEIAFTLSESCNSDKFKSALEFLETKILEIIFKTGVSEIQKSVKSSLEIIIKNNSRVVSTSGTIFSNPFVLLLLINSDTELAHFLKEFDRIDFSWGSVSAIASFSAFTSILEKVIQKQPQKKQKIISDFNSRKSEIKEKINEAKIAALKEKVKTLKIQNQLLLQQQETADKIIKQFTFIEK